MFKFIYESDNHRNELFVDEDGMTHMDVSEWFNQFLRGCGYIFEGSYELLTPEEQLVLERYEREKTRDEFIKSAFDDEGKFPVI